MRYNLLGRTGLFVSELALGTPEYPGWMIATQGAGRRAQLGPPPRGSE